jgi:hypothetical protein
LTDRDALGKCQAAQLRVENCPRSTGTLSAFLRNGCPASPECAPFIATGEFQTIFVINGGSNAFKSADEEARRKSGIQADESHGLIVLTSNYYSTRYIAVESEKRIKEKAGADPDWVRAMESTVAKGKAIKAEYERTYGKKVVEILTRHEEAFLKLQGEGVQALGRNTAKK